MKLHVVIYTCKFCVAFSNNNILQIEYFSRKRINAIQNINSGLIKPFNENNLYKSLD